MQFRVLGPVEVHADDGRVLTLSRRRERCLLAILALDAGRVVPADRLSALLWDDNPPEHYRQAIRTHVARIRSVLATAGAAEHGVAVMSHGGGYLLRADPDLVDAHRFRRLLDQATGTTDPTTRDRLLREALTLWRGPALHNAAPDRLRERLCVDLDEQRLHAIEESLAAGLELGRHHELIPELASLAGEHPLRERFIELHMLALHRAGRTADALDVYTRTRTRLADELGLDPSPGLQHLHQAILRGEPAPGTQPAPPPNARVTPAQLPTDLAGFAGRTDHLDQLDRLLAGTEDTTGGTAVVISAIDGTAGVGKTALAVHWAHRVADRFPDGQLYVNLRGFDPSGQIMEPATAVRGFLDALEVPPQRIPTDLDAQTALYRSLLTGRRMLIVLDNARDTTQVRPLLPGAPGCLVVVTSRNQLTSLIAATGAHPVTLDLLTDDEARHLLAQRIGVDRITAESDAVQEIITRCARLPLALTLVAAHAAIQHNSGLHALAEHLHDTQHRWQTLTGDDPHTDVRTVFSWSYHTLTPDAARLFRLIGLHPGPDITAPPAASLSALTPVQVRPLLAELTRANLITEHTPGRYTLHDLLRAYTTHLTHTTDPDEERHAATHRLLDHYLHTAYAVDRLLHPGRDPLDLAPPRPGVTPEHLTDHQQALDWLTTEHPVLLAAVDHAADSGFDTHTWQLAGTIRTFLDRQGHWHDQATTQRAAVAAARRLADPHVQARTHLTIAHAYIRLGRSDDAHTHLQRSLDLHRRTGDQVGQAHTHNGLAIVWEQQGHPSKGLHHIQQALNLFRAAGHQRGQAYALNGVGWCHILLGDYQQAVTYCEQSLALQHGPGDHDVQAATWDSLGYAHHHLGHHAEALTCYQHALDLSQNLRDRYGQATTLTHIGDIHHAAGNPQAARDTYQQALMILTDLDHPDAETIRAKLTALTPINQPADGRAAERGDRHRSSTPVAAPRQRTQPRAS